MKSFILLCLNLLLINHLFAQEAKLLTKAELDQVPWFYDMESAMEHPEKVYNLSVTWEKMEAFPTETFKLINLQHLDFMDNRIEEIPADISKLKNLQILALSNNKIEKIPEAIKALKHLEVLQLDRNRISTLPEWLNEMPALKKISLRENKITKEEIEALQKRFPNIDLTH